jgi:hypothetical protein
MWKTNEEALAYDQEIKIREALSIMLASKDEHDEVRSDCIVPVD